MQLAWLANTDAGVMVGDYISTSIIPSDGLVLPVFALANLLNGSTLHEATYTAPRQVVGLFGVDRTRFPWTPVWANEAGRPEGIGDEPGEGWSGGGDGDGGSGAADGRGATRAVECACQDGDRAAALEGRGARGSVAGDSGAGARARALAPALPRGRDEWVQAPGHAGGRARAQARAGEGRRADDEARDRGVVPGKKRLRGGGAEVEALRRAVSSGTHQRYTVTLICEVLHAPRASVYAAGVAR